MEKSIYIDPEMAPALERQKARRAGRAPIGSLSPETIRERARADFAAMNAVSPEISLVENTVVEGAFGTTQIRIYDALGDRVEAPGMIYFHGGGWIVGDLDSEDSKLRRLALESQVRIVSVDYVLAPEHRFPDPVYDCIAAAENIHHDAARLGLDPSRLAIGGASAGANLALSTAVALRDKRSTWLQFILLFYGVFDIESTAPSRKIFGDGFGTSIAEMEYFYSQYFNRREERSDHLASPLFAKLTGLPPTYIDCAGADLLRDDSRSLAARLRTAGVSCQFNETPGVLHGYTLLGHEVAAARNAIKHAAHALRARLD